MYADRKKQFFAISRKQELIEQNYGHLWIQRAQIILEKLLSTLQQTACWPVLLMINNFCQRLFYLFFKKNYFKKLSIWGEIFNENHIQ